jgi:hypothetical protein
MRHILLVFFLSDYGLPHAQQLNSKKISQLEELRTGTRKKTIILMKSLDTSSMKKISNKNQGTYFHIRMQTLSTTKK